MNDRKTLDERQQMTDLERLRHSSAHVMATAILRIWPDAQFAYGPPIDAGFYYDFEMKHRITPDDFEKIEAEMKKIAKDNQKFEYKAISRDEAKAMAESGRLGGLTERPGNPSRFKLDLIEKIPEGEQISCFQNGDFIDLCAGPHVGYTSKCKNVKLMSVSSSFYLGDEKKGQLQRLYGTAFENKELLEEHLNRLEEAKKRDHRRLGKELGLFHIDEMVGQGLVLWKPKGALVRRALQEFITEELDKQGYSQVFTPHIGKLELYKTSGHFPYYKESQFAPVMENDSLAKVLSENCSCGDAYARLEAVSARLRDSINQRTGREAITPDRVRPDDQLLDGFMLKPMNCPHHIKIFASQPHSYRDLPVRLAEFGTVYRWEQSGELNGMTRVRGFTQDDAHLFCTEEQVGQELLGCLSL
ncbi:MAG: threonine--tRNA ligase, partial [Gloeobacteraceae cyanobacterium ES-bin-144]|nr:threonine--tRNA ligase [Verrucomicrobiales bacterium]